MLWPALVRLALAGARLFPSRTGKDVLDELRSFARAKEWRNAERIGTQSLLMGAAREILEAGGSLAQLLEAG